MNVKHARGVSFGTFQRVRPFSGVRNLTPRSIWKQVNKRVVKHRVREMQREALTLEAVKGRKLTLWEKIKRFLFFWRTK